MPTAAIELGAALLLVLPGFLAYRFAVWRRAEPSTHGALWQLAEILEYSAFVHLIGAALALAAHFFIGWAFGVNSLVKELAQTGPADFLRTYPEEATLWFILYPVYVIVSTPVLGAYQLPTRVAYKIVKLLANPLRWLSSKSKALQWLPMPDEAYSQEPVWHLAFDEDAEGYQNSPPFVFVTLKSGDAFYGQIDSYPIASDTERSKDFLISHARYYKGGNLDLERRLYESDGIGAVLLNSANVDSIILHYEGRQEPGN